MVLKYLRGNFITAVEKTPASAMVLALSCGHAKAGSWSRATTYDWRSSRPPERRSRTVVN